MGTSESGPSLGYDEVGESPKPASPPPTGGLVDPRLFWALALGAGLAAGLLSWGVGELTRNAFQPRKYKVQVMLQTFVQPTAESISVASFKNSVLAFAILGGVTGLVMGLAGGLAARSPSRGLAVGMGAAVFGSLLCALTSWFLLPFFYRRIAPNPNDFLTPMLVHAGIWIDAGAIGGMALALGAGALRRVPHAIAGGCAGAVLATVVFHSLGATLFPAANYMDPLADHPLVCLVSRMLVTVLAAAGAARLMIDAPATAAPPVPAH